MSRPKRLPPKPGWAMYLRTSSDEAQNPENSQRRQRHAIERALIEKLSLPLVDEYIDNLSGRYAGNRPDYQRMLNDARAGLFSHVFVENAERFGRNDSEALTAIDELHALGIAVRFADYPDLDPMDPDDRILVSLSFTLARRESIKLGQRVTGGLHAKLRAGGCSGIAPDGYVNCEQRTEQDLKLQHGKYTRWVEQDPKQAAVWRLAWDLLLSDQHTLEQICEALHAQGYTYRSGRPFVKVKVDGTRIVQVNTLSKIFHNWFYAGWVVSEKAQIPPKTICGTWQPLVTTEEFEQGLAILARRNTYRVVTRKHDYLLKGLIYIHHPVTQRLVKLTGSSSNTKRPGGGTAYYCIPRSNLNFPCKVIDNQLDVELSLVQIDPQMLPLIRASYTKELADRLGHVRPSDQETLKKKLRELEEEETRAARLFASGKITERVWDNLWAEWQDRRRTLRMNLEALQEQHVYHIANLDAALAIIAEVSVIYRKLERSDKKQLLRQMIERVIVDPEDMSIKLELLPPFSYLHHLNEQVRQGGKENVAALRNKTTGFSAGCLDWLSSSTPNGT